MTTVSDALREAAELYDSRNAQYKDGYKRIGDAMKALFPDGLHIVEASDHTIYHLFQLALIKMMRLASTNFGSVDSARDLIVYAAMLEEVIKEVRNVKR